MTRQEYLEIRRLHEEGLSIRAIAKRLGVHRRNRTLEVGRFLPFLF